MLRSTPRRLWWGWTTTVRAWLTIFGAIIALGLIAGSETPDGPPAPAPRLIVDPNTAPPEVLIALPRLGPVLVSRIVAAREEAPFGSLGDLDVRVRGIGPATFASLRPYLEIKQSGTEAKASPSIVSADPGPR
jgi:competence protein ComEA